MNDNKKPSISQEKAVAMLAMLRDARAMVYRDAESFDQAVTTLEHIGQILTGEVRIGLGHYEAELLALASMAPRTTKRKLTALFETVRTARNDSVHSGDYIRHHVLRLVELCLALEEALASSTRVASDLMVRSPVIAEGWHNIASIRRSMLANSFSYLPAKSLKGDWMLVSDVRVVKYLNSDNGKTEEKELLGHSLERAMMSGKLKLTQCKRIGKDCPIEKLASMVTRVPLLVTEEKDGTTCLLGILTAFDLL